MPGQRSGTLRQRLAPTGVPECEDTSAGPRQQVHHRSPATALWQPDLLPPSRWLYPAVLYQERISTIRPLDIEQPVKASHYPRNLENRLREAREQAEVLGNLHVSTSFNELTVDEAVDAELEACAARWRRVGETMPTNTALGAWSRGLNGEQQRKLADEFERDELPRGWTHLIGSKLNLRIIERLMGHVRLVRVEGPVRLLIGPTEVVAHAMAILAAAHCEVTGMIPMGPDLAARSEAWLAYHALDDESLVDATVASFLMKLPAPAPETPLEEVVTFRRRFDEELEITRQSLASTALGSGSFGDTPDFIAEANRSMARALAEVERALRLAGRLSSVECRTVAPLLMTLGATAGAVAQDAVQTAVAGLVDNGIRAFEHFPAIELTLGGVTAATGAVALSQGRSWIVSRRARGRVERSGLVYLYAVGRQFPGAVA